MLETFLYVGLALLVVAMLFWAWRRAKQIRAESAQREAEALARVEAGHDPFSEPSESTGETVFAGLPSDLVPQGRIDVNDVSEVVDIDQLLASEPLAVATRARARLEEPTNIVLESDTLPPRPLTAPAAVAPMQAQLPSVPPSPVVETPLPPVDDPDASWAARAAVRTAKRGARGPARSAPVPDANAQVAVAREMAARALSAKQAALREAAEREAASREVAAREAAGRELAARQAARQASEREAAVREAAAREEAARQAQEREAAERERRAREAAAREAAARVLHEEAKAAQTAAERRAAERHVPEREAARRINSSDRDVPLREVALAWFEARGYRSSAASAAVRPIELVLRHKNDPARAYAFVVEGHRVSPDRVHALRAQAKSIGLVRLLIVADAGAEPAAREVMNKKGVRLMDRVALDRELNGLDFSVAAKIIAIARKRATSSGKPRNAAAA